MASSYNVLSEFGYPQNNYITDFFHGKSKNSQKFIRAKTEKSIDTSSESLDEAAVVTLISY